MREGRGEERQGGGKGREEGRGGEGRREKGEGERRGGEGAVSVRQVHCTYVTENNKRNDSIGWYPIIRNELHQCNVSTMYSNGDCGEIPHTTTPVSLPPCYRPLWSGTVTRNC